MVKRARKALSFRAWVGPRGGDAGLSEVEIRANTGTNRPTNPGNRRKAEHAPVGPHTTNQRLVFARVQVLSRQETETRAEKLEAPPNRPRVTTDSGAGFVSWGKNVGDRTSSGFSE